MELIFHLKVRFVSIFSPSGAPDFDSGDRPFGSKTEHWTNWYSWKSWVILDMHKTTGTWTVVISINGEPFITVPVEVVETVDLNLIKNRGLLKYRTKPYQD